MARLALAEGVLPAPAELIAHPGRRSVAPSGGPMCGFPSGSAPRGRLRLLTPSSRWLWERPAEMSAPGSLRVVSETKCGNAPRQEITQRLAVALAIGDEAELGQLLAPAA
jgi:hypothetical protein